MRCGNCGNSQFQKVSMKGKTFPWKDFPFVFISVENLFLNVCMECKEVHLSARNNEIEKLDSAIRESIKHQFSVILDAIKEKSKLSQTELCDIIRVSPQHLSNVKNGSKDPSYQLFIFLATLADNPRIIEFLKTRHVPKVLQKVVGQ